MIKTKDLEQNTSTTLSASLPNPTSNLLLLFTMKQRSTYWQLSPYIRPHRWTIVCAFLWTLAYTAFWPIQSWLVGQISKYVGGDVGMLAQFAVAGGLVYVLQGIAQYWQDVLMAKAAFGITLDLRQRTYGHLLRLSSDRLSQIQVGDLSYRLTEDIDRVGGNY